jgi:hypothetical protein
MKTKIKVIVEGRMTDNEMQRIAGGSLCPVQPGGGIAYIDTYTSPDFGDISTCLQILLIPAILARLATLICHIALHPQYLRFAA